MTTSPPPPSPEDDSSIPYSQVLAQLERGRSLRTCDRKAAQECFEQCAIEAEATGDTLSLAVALSELALTLMETEQKSAFGRAKSLLLRAEALLLQVQAPEPTYVAAYLRYCRGLLYLYEYNFVDSLVHLRSAQRALTDHPLGLALVHDGLGQYYALLGDFQAAMHHLEQSLAHRQNAGDDRALGTSYRRLGELYLEMCLYDRAESYFQTCLEIAEQWEDNSLCFYSLMGLGRVANAQQFWGRANTFFNRAMQFVREPADTIRVAYLHLELADAQLGKLSYTAALDRVIQEAVPRFQRLHHNLGLASANRLLGRIYTAMLRDGILPLEQDNIEQAEDCFLDSSLLFEQQGIPQEYAKTLYEMALLYRVCNTTPQRYQYQGKAVRSLEIALSILERIHYGAANLVFQIEILLNQVDRTVWLERTVHRLRERKTIAGTSAMKGRKEDVAVLAVELHGDEGFLGMSDAERAVRLLNLYLQIVSEIAQKYQGIPCGNGVNGLTFAYRWLDDRPSGDPGANTLPSFEVRLPTTESHALPPAVRAVLTAQDILAAMQGFNLELAQYDLPPQQVRAGVDVGTALVGNFGHPDRLEFGAIGEPVTIARRLCESAPPNAVCVSDRAIRALLHVMSPRAICSERMQQPPPGIDAIDTFVLRELSFSPQSTRKPSWLTNAEFPNVLRIEFPLREGMDNVLRATVAAVAYRLGFKDARRLLLGNSCVEVYQEILQHVPTATSLRLVFLPEEAHLDVAFALEGLTDLEVRDLQAAFGRWQRSLGNGQLAPPGQCTIETSPTSVLLRLSYPY